jgi:hypothetical protein
MMQLTWLRLTSPRADTSAFKALLQQFDQVLKNKDANPAAVFSDTVQMTLAGGHPRVRALSVEMLQELNLNEMLAIYRDRFADLGDFTFLFVGNVDLAVLKPLVEQWLAPLPAAGRKESFKDVGPMLFRGQIDKTVRKGIAPVQQELDSLRRVPPSAAEVERVREQQRRELEVARKQNGYWLSTIRNRLENGDDLGTIGNEDSMIAGLTSDKLAAAAKRYLTEVNRARFVLLPEGR